VYFYIYIYIYIYIDEWRVVGNIHISVRNNLKYVYIYIYKVGNMKENNF
jgi:hypothetical protein